MAKATVEKIPPKPVESELRYTLELNHGEAQTLVAILRNVGGCPKTSRRKHAIGVLEALRAVGVDTFVSTTYLFEDGKSVLYFRGGG